MHQYFTNDDDDDNDDDKALIRCQASVAIGVAAGQVQSELRSWVSLKRKEN